MIRLSSDAVLAQVLRNVSLGQSSVVSTGWVGPAAGECSVFGDLGFLVLVRHSCFQLVEEKGMLVAQPFLFQALLK